MKWFRRVFSQTGVLADPDKIAKIITAGRPESLEDVRSFLQAASYNAKFAFSHEEGQTYKEATGLLRELQGKDKVFKWTQEREDSYQTIIRMMSDSTTLRPFQTDKKTHLVTDASPVGIAASLYQEEGEGSWVP